MRVKKTVLTVLTLFVGLTMCAAQNPHLGTWKLNEAKSKITPGTQKNLTVSYEAAGDNIKATLDGVDAQGKPTHNEWTGKFDGKDYPVTGDATSDTRSYKKIDDRTMEATAKKDGKVTLTLESLFQPTARLAPSPLTRATRQARKLRALRSMRSSNQKLQ